MTRVRVHQVLLAQLLAKLPFGDREARQRRYEELYNACHQQQAELFKKEYNETVHLLKRNGRLRKQVDEVLTALEAKR